MSSTSVSTGQGSYTVGPTLPAELPKPPYRPRVAGRIAFFFGPIAGAFVASINLRRMGYPAKAKRVHYITLLFSVVAAVILILTPDALVRLVGLGMEIGFYMIFPRLQDVEFAEWQTANSDVQTSNGWAAIGWGFLGLLLFVVVAFVVVIAISALGIPVG